MAGVLGPYFSAHFILTPSLFYALFGPTVAITAMGNLLAAEILTNLHSFAIVVPNHAGEDVYRFETPVKVCVHVRVCQGVRACVFPAVQVCVRACVHMCFCACAYACLLACLLHTHAGAFPGSNFV
jgi:hypothetical protein